MRLSLFAGSLRDRLVRAAIATVGVVALSAGSAAAAAAPATWTRLYPASSPSPRDAVMAYDGATNQTVLFGGFDVFSLGDTWTWDGTNWTQRSPATSPPARSFDQMAYDAASRQLIMFGGLQIPFTGLADTWEWTGSNWAQLNPATSPPNRNGGQMAYDPVTSQIVLFGGAQQVPGQPSDHIENDTWTWNGSTWTQQHPATSPPPIVNGQLAFDPALNELVLFGGQGASGTWAWNGSTWSQLTLSTGPSGRFDNQMALDPTSGQVIQTGGTYGGAPLSDTWALGTTWTQLSPATPAPAVDSAGFAEDPGSRHLVEFGGLANGTRTNSTWIWGPLTVTAQSLGGGSSGLVYSHALQATGGVGSLHWQVSSGALPAGLSLSPTDGVISGTPTSAGTDTFTVKVTDSASSPQSATRTFTLTFSPGPIPGVYVANLGNSEIHGFALGSSGDAIPEVSLAGPATTLNGVGGLVFDQQGRLYVANRNLNTVDVFAPGVSGNIAPVAVLGGSHTDISTPSGLTFDSAGDLYVADPPANTITVYSAGTLAACLQLGQGPACNVAPVRTIAGSQTQLDNPQGLTVDGAGNLWVANQSSNQLTEYVPDANGDVAPVGPATAGVDGPQGLTFESPGDPVSACGYLLSANTFGQSITLTPPCSPTSASQIAGANTELDFPDGIDVDADGRIYVANEFAGLNVYAAGAGYNSAPLAVINGSATGLSSPGAVTVTPPLHIVTRSLPAGRAGRGYHARLHSVLGRPPLRWRLVKGRLPEGLRLTSKGTLEGVPHAAGRFRVEVKVSDSTRPPMHATRTLTLTIKRRHGRTRARHERRREHTAHGQP